MGGWWNSTLPDNAQALTIDQAWQSAEKYVKDFWNAELQLTEVMELDNQFLRRSDGKKQRRPRFRDDGEQMDRSDRSRAGAEHDVEYKIWAHGIRHDGRRHDGRSQYGLGWAAGYRPWGNPGKEMPVNAAQAHTYAQQFLDVRLPGMKVETDADVFYGYYTIHVLNKDGSVYGMLGVNGYTGWVWYHEWHGKFIAMKELKDMKVGR
jgi:hypothetical protein